jgi:predicted glycosyltransferase
VKKILFISGSLGLGHVGRDIEIAKELRKLRNDVEISWMAEPPASDVLKKEGEKLLPEASDLYSSNLELEKSTKEYKANLVQWVKTVQQGWSKNVELYAKISEIYDFDLWIGDEPYDIMIALVKNPSFKKCPFVVINDCLGLDTNSWNIMEHLIVSMTNKAWMDFLKHEPPLADLNIMIGEKEDIPDKSFGFMRPNRRRIAEEFVKFVGYILPEELEKFKDKAHARELLGYGSAPSILCSIGGTSAGKDLLKLCIDAYPTMKQKIPTLKMILVCGPRLSPDSFKVPDGVKTFGYIPDLYRHLGAADLSIVTGGGTITLELTALERPFLYFPLQEHAEQQFAVAPRCRRHNAGVRMDYAKTTPKQLADIVVSNIGKPVNYPKLLTKGAEEAARLINQILSSKV